MTQFKLALVTVLALFAFVTTAGAQTSKSEGKVNTNDPQAQPIDLKTQKQNLKETEASVAAPACEKCWENYAQQQWCSTGTDAAPNQDKCPRPNGTTGAPEKSSPSATDR